MSALFGRGPTQPSNVPQSRPSGGVGSLVPLQDGSTIRSPRGSLGTASRSGPTSASQPLPAARLGAAFAGGVAPGGDDSGAMTYQDVQELIRAERLWWSEASERQVKQLENALYAEIKQASEKLANLSKQVEEKMSQRIEEEREERQAALAVMRCDVDKQQVVTHDLSRNTPAKGVASEETLTALKLFQSELEMTRQGQRSTEQRLEAQNEELKLQVLAVEAGANDLRRELAEQKGQESKLKMLETAVASIRAEHSDLRRGANDLKERQEHHAMALREAAGTDATVSDLRKEVEKLQDEQEKKMKRVEIDLSNLQSDAASLHNQHQDHKEGLERYQRELDKTQQSLDHTRATQQQTAIANGDDLSRKVAEMASKLSAAEDGLRKEMRAMCAEHEGSFTRDVQDRCSELSRALDAERAARVGEVAELRANFQMSCEKTERMSNMAVPPAVLEDRCRELSANLDKEKEERISQEKEVRKDYENVTQKLSDRIVKLEDRASRIETDKDAISSKASDASSKCDVLKLNLEAEVAEMHALLEKELATKIQEEMKSVSSQQTRSASGTATPASLAPSAIDMTMTSQSQVNTQTKLAQIDTALIDAAFGRERAACAARGDLPSQLRAELVSRLEETDTELRSEIRSKFDALDRDLRTEINNRVGTLDTDLRCEFGGRFSAVEAELRVASTSGGGGGPIAARLATVEQDLRHVEAQCCKHEGFAARVEALESNSALGVKALEAELRRILPATMAANTASTDNAGKNDNIRQMLPGTMAIAAGDSAAAERMRRSSYPMNGGGNSPRSASRDVHGPISVTAPIAVENIGAVDEPFRGRSLRGQAQSVPATRSASVQARQEAEARIMQPPTPRQGQTAPGAQPLMNSDLKESLVSLVSKVHSALAGKAKPEEEGQISRTPPKIEASSGALGNASARTPSAPPVMLGDVALAPGQQTPLQHTQPATPVTDVQSQFNALKVLSHSSRNSPLRQRPEMSNVPPMAPPVLGGVPAPGADGANADVSESREVFKQALQELLQENRALQKETSQIMEHNTYGDRGADVYAEDSGPATGTTTPWRQPVGGSMQLPIGVGGGPPGGVLQNLPSSRVSQGPGGSMQLPSDVGRQSQIGSSAQRVPGGPQRPAISPDAREPQDPSSAYGTPAATPIGVASGRHSYAYGHAPGQAPSHQQPPTQSQQQRMPRSSIPNSAGGTGPPSPHATQAVPQAGNVFPQQQQQGGYRNVGPSGRPGQGPTPAQGVHAYPRVTGSSLR